MKESTLIFGHKNPDTDSICSAIAYSNLKNILGKNTKAMRLGNINKETAFALEYFKCEEPEYISTIKPTLANIKKGNKTVIKSNDSIKRAIEILTNENHSSLPVVNNENKLESLLSISQIANAYLEMSTQDIFDKHYTNFNNILDSLNGTLINGTLPSERVTGNLKSLSEIKPGQKHGVALTTDLSKINKKIDTYGISLLVVSGYKKIDTELVENIKTPIILTSHSIFKSFKLISHSVSVHSILSHKPFYHFRTSDYIEDINMMMKEADQTNFPVVNDKGEVFSTIRTKHLFNSDKLDVILVDHNEKIQSIDGIETARIVEIIDHHKFGDVETSEPLMIRAESVGCTSTIIYRLFNEVNIVPSKQIAGLMLSAILSDTLIFKSPTTTKRDVEVAKTLAKIANVDYQKYGMDLLIAGASLSDKTSNEILTMDMKEFAMGKYSTALSQVNTVDIDSVLNNKEDLENEINVLIGNNNYDLFILVITDILNKGSQIIALGNATSLVNSAFSLKLENNMMWLKGVVSRKKQIVPVLMQASQE